MNTFTNNKYDAIEKLIYYEGLRIEAVDIHPELGIMIIILNTKAILHQSISSYSHLKNADKSALLQFELIAGGTGIHWPQLDEDLSLKGFLQDELRRVVKNDKDALAA